MKKITKLFNKSFIENKLYIYSFMFILILLNCNTIFANDLLNNPITEGAKKILQDASKLIMILSTVATPFLIAFYQLKKKMSDDEMEGKQYDKKTKGIVFCYIIIMSASLIVAIVSTYFKIGISA